ncbi:hypothetical protein [Streptomyces sp. NBC_00091]|uniref:hypothetical protein n=1 Tax=Streptomyces sp. NBC_00091 TaxID=2975648 RepID=UPI00225B12AE|nr:hypothetical protein [Streptomyces sp. NBC_00091]MCX5376192.1 hypothetical protein [Streptomyces sp. NBC_00091]
MKRTRTAALALAAAAAAVAPALGQASATAAPGTGFLQDPAGGEHEMKSMWTNGQKHKLEGQVRFHPGIQYKTVARPALQGDTREERQVADPSTLAWQPSYEFAWAVSDVLVNKGLTTKNGTHPIVVHAVLRDAKGAKAAEVEQKLTGQPATGRQKVAGGKRIACDTGEYTVEWSLTRTHYGTLTGTLRWDSSCEQYRTAFSSKNG